MPTTPVLIATAEAARRLGVHVRTIHRLVASGRLTPAVKIPGQTGAYLFDADDIARLQRERAPAA